ncbi:MAG: hypothetical protein ACMUEM_07565 [Flavobacteriales bacterium AspAUS03]
MNITTLLEKLKEGGVSEVIFAMSSTIEGDIIIFYIYKQINSASVKLPTIIDQWISVGDELEYENKVTLRRYIRHRMPYEEMLREQR